MMTSSSLLGAIGVACGSVFGPLSYLFYFRMMDSYLELNRTKFDFLVDLVLMIGSTLGLIIVCELSLFGDSFFISTKGAKSAMLLYQQMESMGMPAPFTVIIWTVVFVFSTIKVFKLLYVSVNRNMPTLMSIGIFLSFGFQANDIFGFGLQWEYAVPLVGYAAMIEIFRITREYHHESFGKTVQLEREVRTVGAQANMAFVAGSISHDLKNHLTKSITAIDILKDRFSKEYNEDLLFKKYLDIAQNGIARIQKLSTNYLEILRGKPVEQKEMITVKEVIDNAKDLLADSIKKSQVDLQVILNDPEYEIYVNRILLEQVLINLVSNSIDAVKENESSWIKLSFDRDRGDLFFKVTDSGKGIPVSQQDKIFTRAYSTKDNAGNGLGLWIAREISLDMGGSLNLNPAAGNTQFVLRLPEE